MFTNYFDFPLELNVRNVKKVPDVLLQNLTQANTFDETMNIVDKHSLIFNKTHILRVSKTLFELTKTDPYVLYIFNFINIAFCSKINCFYFQTTSLKYFATPHF